MEKSLIIAGFGGQGVMVIGQLLAYTAFETTDKKVTCFPSYGAEQRGGTANCFVVIRTSVHQRSIWRIILLSLTSRPWSGFQNR